MVPPERDHLMLVQAHLRALVDVNDTMEPLVHTERLLRCQSGTRERRDVVDPLPGSESRVRVLVVRLPEGAGVGRQSRTADHDGVACHPRRDGNPRALWKANNQYT